MTDHSGRLKSKKCKRAPSNENIVGHGKEQFSYHCYPPPPLNRVGLGDQGKKSAITPPPTNARVGFRRPRKNSATTPPTESRRFLETTGQFCYYPPPPTESRRLVTSHERGPLFRKILDLLLDHNAYDRTHGNNKLFMSKKSFIIYHCDHHNSRTKHTQV